MSASLLLSCGLNEQKLPLSIHLSEESDVDGSFLISSILGQRLRIQNCDVILICLQNTYQHYLNAGIKLGYNLNMFKNLHVLEPIQDIVLSEFGNNLSLAATNIYDISFSNKILTFIKKVIQETFKQGRTSITILMDNLSILINLGDSINSVLKFYLDLKDFIENYSNEEKFITLVTKLNNCEVFKVLDNNIIRMSDLHIKIVKLRSGNFKEVDGKLIIARDELIELCEINRNVKSVLYKVNDRSIKIFNPGEIGIKI